MPSYVISRNFHNNCWTVEAMTSSMPFPRERNWGRGVWVWPKLTARYWEDFSGSESHAGSTPPQCPLPPAQLTSLKCPRGNVPGREDSVVIKTQPRASGNFGIWWGRNHITVRTRESGRGAPNSVLSYQGRLPGGGNLKPRVLRWKEKRKSRLRVQHLQRHRGQWEPSRHGDTRAVQSGWNKGRKERSGRMGDGQVGWAEPQALRGHAKALPFILRGTERA